MERNGSKFKRSQDSSELDYQKGYRDGMQDAFDKSELDAYYAGVGYGKMKSKDKHIGFNSDEERQEFEKGVANKDKHFKSYRAHKTLWERFLLFVGIGLKTSRKDDIKIKNRRQEAEKKVKKNWKGGKKNPDYSERKAFIRHRKKAKKSANRFRKKRG